MAVRLHMKLGVVAEQDRLPDSPDTIVVVEPSVGSVARSKGNLYLLVTSRIGGHRAREATRLVAETIRNEYYYDESAGIRVCLEKAIELANKRLGHQRERLGLGHADGTAGPVGIGVAVVRGNELYVATVGPAEAYLIRQARLSTLPDPHRERGLPTGALEPDVWRGELSVGDSLVIISPEVVARIGTDELKDSMVTLHPQSAMEHLHHRFAAADGAGSDGAIAFEATEVAATHRGRTLVPVRPAEPLAGAPERSPIPLADSVTDGVAAVQASARTARAAAGGLAGRIVWRIQDLLPRRGPAHRRVTPLSSRREAQRRAAVALLAFVVVVAGLGTGVWWLGGSRPRESISAVTAGQRALEQARAEIGEVWGDGVDLVESDPKRALPRLTTALEQLAVAERNGVAAGTIAPLRSRVVAGLDRIYGVVPIAASTILAIDRADPKPDLAAVVRGSDGMPYVLDRGAGAVYRIDLKTKKAAAIYRAGESARGRAAAPRLMIGAGPDILILDVKNALWRWRPANREGKGTLTKVRISGATGWGDDVRALGSFCRNPPNCDLYNLYVVDPSERQILLYSPASDGDGFPRPPTGRLPTARAVDRVTDLFIDGDIFVAEAGAILRAIPATEWEPRDPGDELLRRRPTYVDLESGTEKRVALLYAFDAENDRLIAVDKAEGAYVAQYRLAGGDRGWAGMRGMYVVPGIEEGPATIVWIEAGAIRTALLEAAPDTPPASPSPAGSPGSASPSPAGSPGSPAPSASP